MGNPNQSLFELFDFFHDAILVAILSGVILPPAGLYLHLRHGLFLGAAIPQIAGLGFVIAEVMGIPTWAAATGILLLFSVAAAWKPLETGNRGALDSGIGLGYVVAMAGIVLLLALTKAEAHAAELLLKGSVLAATCADTRLLLGFGLPLVVFLFVIRRRLFLISLDPETARTMGIDVRLFDSILFLSIGLAVTLTLTQAGAMACFAFLLIPPLCALKLCKRVSPLFVVSTVFGCIGAFGGLTLALAWDLPVGPCMVAVLLILLVSSIVAGRFRQIG